jgi:hypothetical protein
LITYKLALFDLENQLSLNLIRSASLSWTFYQWRESFRVDYLIDLISTSIASIICNLNAWLHITTSGHDTFDDDQRTH